MAVEQARKMPVIRMFRKLFGGSPRGNVPPVRQDDPVSPKVDSAEEVADLLSSGNSMLDSGKPGQAAECYRRATLLDPRNVGALVNLGFALCEQGRHADAVLPLRRATELDPQSVDAHYLLGSSRGECGDLRGAIDSHTAAIQLKPDFSLCRLSLCRLLASTGEIDMAKEVIASGIAQYPNIPDFHLYIGNLLITERKVADAIDAFENALALEPNHRQAMLGLASALHLKGDFHAALTNFERAISLDPADPTAHCSLAATLQALGMNESAILHYRTAVALRPEYAEAHCDLASALRGQGMLDEAVAHYRLAISIRPEFADALSNLGMTLQSKGRLVEALELLRRALSIDQGHAAAHNNLGNVFHEMDRLDESVACYEQALRIAPDHLEARGNLGGVLQEQGHLGPAIESYKKAIALKPDFMGAQSNLLFTVNYHPDFSAEEVFEHYRDYNRRIGIPLGMGATDHENDRGGSRRLKVGYVSPDFREHSIRHFLEPLMAHHDHRVVEVYAYAEVAKEDFVTGRLRSYADQWVPTLGMTDEAMASRIRSDRIDVLVDLAGHTAGNRLRVFARKPAPVSISWLGYGYTTGLSAIDYLLTDEVGAPPGSEHLFAEQPWRLSTPGYAFRPSEGMGQVSALPAAERGFVTFGTLTRAVRINHRTIRVWAQILERVPGSRLVVDSKSYQDAGMRASLIEKFAAHGVDADRLVLGFHSPPWDVLRWLDIGLDCFPHNSGTTLFETIYMGVPFVTLADRPSVGRLGSSILHGLGHPEWIAHTEEEYVDIAVALASDLGALADLRGRLRAEMDASPLRNEVGFARKAEAAYREMFNIWATGSGSEGVS
jgi:protein O-GlcNAc transferase